MYHVGAGGTVNWGAIVNESDAEYEADVEDGVEDEDEDELGTRQKSGRQLSITGACLKRPIG